jgi:hypothetical protein
MGRWVLENDGVCGGFWVEEEEEMWADRMVDMGSANGGYGAFLCFIFYSTFSYPFQQ